VAGSRDVVRRSHIVQTSNPVQGYSAIFLYRSRMFSHAAMVKGGQSVRLAGRCWSPGVDRESQEGAPRRL
jgi:hypothetical protein